MKGKLNVILDLDNTIISAVPTEDFPWNDDSRKKVEYLKLHNMEGYYMVFERPYVQDFLNFIFENFNVSVWSAASKNYVLYIIENVILTKPNRKLQHIFFSYHCNLSKKLYKGGLKQLDLLWDCFEIPMYNSKNTIIIDDLKKIKNIQPCNCINVKPFEFLDDDSPKDTELKKVMNLLKNVLENPNQNCLIPLNTPLKLNFN